MMGPEVVTTVVRLPCCHGHTVRVQVGSEKQERLCCTAVVMTTSSISLTMVVWPLGGM